MVFFPEECVDGFEFLPCKDNGLVVASEFGHSCPVFVGIVLVFGATFEFELVFSLWVNHGECHLNGFEYYSEVLCFKPVSIPLLR